MGAASYVQPLFHGGEWSPTAQGRMDDPRYGTALDRCLNSMPTAEGSWTRRPGIRMIAPTKRGREAKVLPFTFSEAAPYTMEFTDGNLRMYAGNVPVTGLVFEIDDISNETPAVVTLVEGADEWNTGDDIVIVPGDFETQKGLSYVAGRQFKITQIVNRKYALYDPITGANVDGSLISWVPGMVATAARILDIPSPYSDGAWSTLRTVQSQERALLLQRNTEPMVLEALTPPAPDSFSTFSFEPAFFQDGPYLDPVPGSRITPNSQNGIVTLSLSFRNWSNTAAYVKGDFVTYSGNGRSYRSLIDANVGNTPNTSPAAWELANPGAAVGPNGFTSKDIGRSIRLQGSTGNWTWGKITGLSTTGAIPESKGSIWGNMQDMANAFNGSTEGANATRTFQNNASGGGSSARTHSVYIGKNFGSQTEQISRVVVYPDPRSNVRFGDTVMMYSLSPPTTVGNPAFPQVTIRVRGSNASSQPGYTSGTVLASGTYSNGTSPITLNVNNSTSWRWVWVEVAMTQPSSYPNSNSTRFRFRLREVQLFSASAQDEGSAVTAMILGPGLPNINTMTTWRLGVYGGDNGYPTCGCYHEGRLWLSGAVPNRFDASVANEIFNFAPTEANGQVTDRSAISYVLNAHDVNPIFWMKPNAQGIAAGTQGGEWLIAASNESNVLTPTSIQAKRVTKYGCANAEARDIGLSTVFIQTYRRSLMEFISDAYSGKYFGPDLSDFAKHLTEAGIEDLAIQEALSPIVWCQRSDGHLVGTTYRRVSSLSSDEPKYLGWHEHTHGGGRLVTSLCSGPTSDGQLDTLTMVTRDPETGAHHLEFLARPFAIDGEPQNACFVDSAIVPAYAEFATADGKDVLRLHGLWTHNDKQVAAWVSGLDCGDYIVQNGSVDIPFGSAGGLLTKARIASLSGDGAGDYAVTMGDGTFTQAVVGFPYVSRGRLLRPVTREASGARNGPGFAKISRHHSAAYLLHKTQGLFIGTEFAKMLPALFRTPGGKNVPASELFSGLYESTLSDDYNRETKLAWEIRRPYPATVLAVGGFIHTQDE